MAIISKTMAMKVLRVRNIRRLILFRVAPHNRRSEISYKKLKEPISSFNKPSLNSWYNPHIEKVPKGCIPVYVGRDEKRFIIPMACLSTLEFDSLMEMVAEEYGFEQEGALRIPCDEDDFEEILMKCLANHKATCKTRKKKCARDIRFPTLKNIGGLAGTASNEVGGTASREAGQEKESIAAMAR